MASTLVTSTETFFSCLGLCCNGCFSPKLQPQLATSSSVASLVRIPQWKPRRSCYSTTLLSLYAALAPLACSYLYTFLWDVCLYPRTLSARRQQKPPPTTSQWLAQGRCSDNICSLICFSFALSCQAQAGGLAPGPSLSSRWGSSDDVTDVPGHCSPWEEHWGDLTSRAGSTAAALWH